MAFEKVSTQFNSITFGEEDGDLGAGESFTGYYKGMKLVDTKYGKDKPVYTFQTKDGNDVEIWGSATLNIAMTRIGLGNLTQITYQGLGEKKRGQNAAKLFDVAQDKANRIEVTAPPVSFRDDYAADPIETEEEPDAASPRLKVTGTNGPPSADRQAKMNALLGTLSSESANRVGRRQPGSR